MVNSIVTGIVVTAINGVSNYTQYAERYKEDGLGYFVAMSFVGYLNKKKQAEIQKQLDEDEQVE